MPSRDEDGKELTGAEKARARTARVQEQIDAEQATAGPGTPPWSLEFTRAQEPDLDNPLTGLDYVRKLQLIVLKQMATTPFPGPAQRECWRRIQAMAATIGMTHNKAGIESEVKNLRGLLAERQQRSTFVVEEAPGRRPKPATARGQRRGGPRAIPVDALPPDAPTEPEGGDSFDEPGDDPAE